MDMDIAELQKLIDSNARAITKLFKGLGIHCDLVPIPDSSTAVLSPSPTTSAPPTTPTATAPIHVCDATVTTFPPTTAAGVSAPAAGVAAAAVRVLPRPPDLHEQVQDDYDAITVMEVSPQADDVKATLTPVIPELLGIASELLVNFCMQQKEGNAERPMPWPSFCCSWPRTISLQPRQAPHGITLKLVIEDLQRLLGCPVPSSGLPICADGSEIFCPPWRTPDRAMLPCFSIATLLRNVPEDLSGLPSSLFHEVDNSGCFHVRCVFLSVMAQFQWEIAWPSSHGFSGIVSMLESCQLRQLYSVKFGVMSEACIAEFWIPPARAFNWMSLLGSVNCILVSTTFWFGIQVVVNGTGRSAYCHLWRPELTTTFAAMDCQASVVTVQTVAGYNSSSYTSTALLYGSEYVQWETAWSYSMLPPLALPMLSSGACCFLPGISQAHNASLFCSTLFLLCQLTNIEWKTWDPGASSTRHLKHFSTVMQNLGTVCHIFRTALALFLIQTIFSRQCFTCWLGEELKQGWSIIGVQGYQKQWDPGACPHQFVTASYSIFGSLNDSRLPMCTRKLSGQLVLQHNEFLMLQQMHNMVATRRPGLSLIASYWKMMDVAILHGTIYAEKYNCCSVLPRHHYGTLLITETITLSFSHTTLHYGLSWITSSSYTHFKVLCCYLLSFKWTYSFPGKRVFLYYTWISMLLILGSNYCCWTMTHPVQTISHQHLNGHATALSWLL